MKQDGLQNKIIELEELLRIEKENHLKTKIKLKARERELHTITQSTSYKLARNLATVKHLLRVAKSYAHAVTPKRLKLVTVNRRRVKTVYGSSAFNNAFDIAPTSKLAVVVHLYYPELLGYFNDKLKRLSNISYDLFITLPEEKREKFAEIQALLPNAHIALIPNCGRDVLPFIETARKLRALGYEKVLKIHSKKSPHRIDGDHWRDSIIDNLIPSNKDLLKNIQTTLDNTRTGIIGPAGEYVSLLVNFSATGHHTQKLMSEIYDKKLAKELFSISDEYGFFAGTMFWARLDTFTPIIDIIKPEDFEPEFGQEDSTLAHALERLFSVIPELNKKEIYELSEVGIKKIDYHTTNIPKWSEIAIDD